MAETKTQEAVAEPKQDLIDNVDALQARMKEMRKAQQIFATYSQDPACKDGGQGDRYGHRGGQGDQEPLCCRVHLQRVQEHQDLWRDRGGYCLRDQEDRRADRSGSGCHPYYQPHFYRYL